jgi:xanthine dehydrogenase/oxidase
MFRFLLNYLSIIEITIETRTVPLSCATAVAAKLSNQPVRLTLSRAEDMTITGGRHSFLARYKASAVVKKGTNDVKLCSLSVDLFNNGGSAGDLSGPVMDRALFHLDNCYYWPKFHAVGLPCKTAQAPHTAFRGFGGPQGLATCEHILDHLAAECRISPEEIRRKNMYQDNEATPFGMILSERMSGKWNVPTMWDKLYNELNISTKRKEIQAFNAKNKLVKRGLAITPTKFGIAFTAKFMNQGGALVHLYTDGTGNVSLVFYIFCQIFS